MHSYHPEAAITVASFHVCIWLLSFERFLDFIEMTSTAIRAEGRGAACGPYGHTINPSHRPAAVATIRAAAGLRTGEGARSVRVLASSATDIAKPVSS